MSGDVEVPRPPDVSLPAFEGPLDVLLHLVRENQVSIWDIPIVKICGQYHDMLRRMERLDLEIAGEYLVTAAWLLLIKSRMLLPRHDKESKDPREELVERLIEYEKVKAQASELSGLDEVRRGMETVALAAPSGPAEVEISLEDLDLSMLAGALAEVLDRHRRDHPPMMELEPIRFSVRDTIVELYALIGQQRSFPLLSHLLTRPDRVEGITFLISALALVRLQAAQAHQRVPFAEIYLTATGAPLALESLGDV